MYNTVHTKGGSELLKKKKSMISNYVSDVRKIFNGLHKSHNWA